jgi:transglutaminase-like putative cysteine protease
MRRQVLGPRGERSIVVYQATENVVRGIQPKDYLSEILAVRNWIATRLRYKNDPLSTELVNDPQRLVEEIAKHGRAIGDCDDIADLAATMIRQLGREARWATVGFQHGAPHTHIFTIALEPKSNTWVVIDPVAGTQEHVMLSRVKSWRTWRID